MTWVAVGVTGAGMVVGKLNADDQRKQQAAANQANAQISAAQTEFSPWTKIQPQTATMAAQSGPDALGGVVEGGYGAAMMAKDNKMGRFGKGDAQEADPPPVASAPMSAPDQNMMAGMGPEEMARRKAMMGNIA